MIGSLGHLGKGQTYRQVVAQKAALEKKAVTGTMSKRQEHLLARSTNIVAKHQEQEQKIAANRADAAFRREYAKAGRQNALDTAQQTRDNAAQTARENAAAALAQQEAAAAAAAQTAAAATGNADYAGAATGGGTYSSGGAIVPSGGFPGDVSSFAPSGGGASPDITAPTPQKDTFEAAGGNRTKILLGAAALGLAFWWFKKRRK